jgi:hypothetical protein
MNGTRGHIHGDRIFWGLFLIVAGAILLAGRLGIADMSWTMQKFWPLILIVVGFSKFVLRSTVWAGLWLIAVGGWLQMVTLHIYGFTYRSSWPLLLIIVGGGIVLRTIVESMRRRNVAGGERHV